MRAWPATTELPKPLLQVGGRAVLEHVMEIYTRQGLTDFVLATGYKGDLVAEWARDLPTEWSVRCLDTGVDTDTGDRLRACTAELDGTFLATYGDGLGNVDVAASMAMHDRHDGAATVTIVPMPTQYGTIVADESGRVTSFTEKPVLMEHWINAGFFVFDAAAVASSTGSSLERDVLPALAARGALYVYRHDGFWKSMDTQKDVAELDALAGQEGPPWLNTPVTSPTPASSSPEPPGSSGRT